MASMSNKSKASASTSTTNAGITYNASGQRIIPSSQREDGTVRKERKVRPGFTPAEDVVRYQNRTAEAWRTRGTGGIPGLQAVVEPTTTPGAAASANKNAKRRAARKKKADTDTQGAEDNDQEDGNENEESVERSISTTGAKEGISVDEGSNNVTQPTQLENTQINSGESSNNPTEATKDVEKQARNIRKKLSQARELQARREKGEKLLPEQLQKALKLQDLARELEKLGFDS